MVYRQMSRHLQGQFFLHPIGRKAQNTQILPAENTCIVKRRCQLLWIGRYLLEKEIRYKLRVLTGAGILLEKVESLQTLEKTLEQPTPR